jgi:hypothetical protein
MIFVAKKELLQKYLSRAKKRALLTILFFIFFATFSTLVYSHTYSGFHVSLIQIIIPIVFFVGLIRTTKKQFDQLSNVIQKIDIEKETLAITTTASAFYFNLFSYDSIELSIDRNLVKISAKNIKSGVYILTYAGDDYILGEPFFDEFEKLRSALEK